MIIITDDKKTDQLDDQQQAIETPPPYSAQQTTPASEPNNVSLRVNGLPVPATTHTHTPPPRTPQLPIWPTQPPPPNVTPINHKHIYSQQERLRQQFVIDPYLQSPGCPPPQYIIDDDNDTDASGNGIASRSKTVYSDHRNLKILIQDGDVNADIWILGGNESTLPTRVSIEITVHNGPITLRIHTPHPYPPSLHLHLTTRNAPLTLSLPRPHHHPHLTGPLTTRTPNGWVSLSRALSSDITTFSESGRTARIRKAWLGDITSLRRFTDESTWSNTFIDLACENGRIRISYTDEPEGERIGVSNAMRGIGARVASRLANEGFGSGAGTNGVVSGNVSVGGGGDRSMRRTGSM